MHHYKAPHDYFKHAHRYDDYLADVDIQLQGKTVLKGFDPVAAAGGLNRAAIQVFEGIRADRALDIRFITADHSRKILPPILSAVEVLLDK